MCRHYLRFFVVFFFFFSSRRRHTRLQGDWSSDVCSSDLTGGGGITGGITGLGRDDAAEARGKFGGHRRNGSQGEQRGQRTEPRVDLRAAGAAGDVRLGPRGPALAEQALPAQGQRLRVHVAAHAWLSPPPSAAETRGLACWFRSGEPCRFRRRCASCGSSLARPLAHLLFTVPGETPSNSAVSATE